MAELEALIDEAEETILDPAEKPFDEACFAVIAVGEASGITVDVSCEDRRYAQASLAVLPPKLPEKH
ncbi:MAG: hypothetical protein IH865_01455 [Chloroflexi bacterium]|nr:hypothetical protein [Chloroflexota bacterium]